MTKQEHYEIVFRQIQAVIEGETDIIANMANIAAILQEEFGFWWTGFYIVKGEKTSPNNEDCQQLVLGPFQGPVACTRIKRGRGVCGTSWKNKETIIVPNVHQFEGHIACSSESNSEIVVPLMCEDEVVAVLDIDSRQFNTFDLIDRQYLEQIVALLCL